MCPNAFVVKHCSKVGYPYVYQEHTNEDDGLKTAQFYTFGIYISAKLNGQLKVSDLIGLNFNLGYKTKVIILTSQVRY